MVMVFRLPPHVSMYPYYRPKNGSRFREFREVPQSLFITNHKYELQKRRVKLLLRQTPSSKTTTLGNTSSTTLCKVVMFCCSYAHTTRSTFLGGGTKLVAGPTCKKLLIRYTEKLRNACLGRRKKCLRQDRQARKASNIHKTSL